MQPLVEDMRRDGGLLGMFFLATLFLILCPCRAHVRLPAVARSSVPSSPTLKSSHLQQDAAEMCKGWDSGLASGFCWR
jgi:hypothetical protein